MPNMRDASKFHYDISPDGRCSLEQINSGSLQRIADATEVMATNFLQLQHEVESQKRRAERNWAEVQDLQKQLSIQKGLVTRYKNKLKNQ